MKASRDQIERALDRPATDPRLFLLYGPDDAGSRALAKRLERAFGSAAERIDIEPSVLKGDPARLVDEAASLSLFGDARHIRVAAAGDEVLGAVDLLLAADVVANPVIIIAGALKPTSGLLKAALAAKSAMAFASYPLEGAEAERAAATLAREAGLRISTDGARQIATMAGNDRAIMVSEITKLALFLDAAPDRPRDAGIDDVTAIGAGEGEGTLARLVDAVLDGQPALAALEIARNAQDGVTGIALIRAFTRRIHVLIRFRAEVEGGASVKSVIEGAGKSLFWKEQTPIARQLNRWSAARIATVANRLLDAERAIKASGSTGTILADAELIAIARAGARVR